MSQIPTIPDGITLATELPKAHAPYYKLIIEFDYDGVAWGYSYVGPTPEQTKYSVVDIHWLLLINLLGDAVKANKNRSEELANLAKEVFLYHHP